ncbi:MAG: hypothetical protein GY854_15040 [Deltaproteobacteria bacterium]|nr:hypothetical protein [Deltaproteobacteria bacterium]
MNASSPPRLMRWQWFVVMTVVSGCIAYYTYVASAGNFIKWHQYSVFFDQQARGYLAGHLHISREPHKRLLRAAKPFKIKNRRFWYHDACLYNGHYYIYWGPVPALVAAFVKIVTGITATIGDQYLTFGFMIGRLIAGIALIISIWRRLFADTSFAIALVFIVVYAIGFPVPYILARGAVYEAAITGGQCFLVAGLYFAFRGCYDTARYKRFLVSAGVCWGLAIGTRVSLSPCIALLGIISAIYLWRVNVDRRIRHFIVSLCCIGLPVCLAMMALLGYNYARFDSWFEFGTNYQLSNIQFRLSLDYVWHNLYGYFVLPPELQCQFPFVFSKFHLQPEMFPSGWSIPKGYKLREPVAGIFVAAPWCLLGGFALVQGGRIALDRWLRGATRAGRSEWLYQWCVASFSVIGVTTMLAVYGLFLSTMRYELDAAAGWILLGVMGAVSVLRYVSNKPAPLRAIVLTIVLLLASASVITGVLYGFQGYYRHFEKYNRPHYNMLRDSITFCGATVKKPGSDKNH